MDQLLQFTVLGLASGALYALSAHGLVLVYRGSGVLNFAQGAFGMTGAFLYYQVGDDHGWSTPVRLVAALAVPGALGAATQLVVMRRLRRASPLLRLTATLAVMFLILAIATKLFGTIGASVVSPLPHQPVRLPGGRAAISADRLWLIAIAVAVTAVISVACRRTRFGRLTSAVADNAVALASLGHSPDTIAAVNWALGGVLAAGAGILIAPALLLRPVSLTLIVLPSIAAALLGRFQSFWLTMAGALSIGVTESLISRYLAHSGIFIHLTSRDGLLFGAFSAQAVSRSIAFLVVAAVLVSGGRALPLRGERLDRLPALGTGRVRWYLAAPALAVAAVIVATAPDTWASAVTISLAYAIILLSVVTVTGYGGQLSLAQMAIAGLGAWACGRLTVHGISFVIAAPVAIATATATGACLALLSSRTRGVSLAVLTLGVSTCLVELVLTNPALTGGLAGTRVTGLSVFGWRLDPFDHPRQYGLVVLGAFALAALGVARLRGSALGRRLVAVRDNELAAAALGVDPARVKVVGFAVGAAIAALGGIMLAFRQHTLELSSFSVIQSVQSLLFTTLGGIGYVLGAADGALLAPGGVAAQVFNANGLEQQRTLDVIAGALLLAFLLIDHNGLVHGPAKLAAALAARRRRGSAAEHQPPAFGEPPPAHGERLEVRNLTVRYGGVRAVDGVSFDIGPGEVVGIIGPNGAGKTTILDAVTGFIAADADDIRIGDRSLRGQPAFRRARAGIQRSFQGLELFDDLTVEDNVLLGCEQVRGRARPGRGPSRWTPAAWHAARRCGLASCLKASPGSLPHGTRRLVAIARAVAPAPGVLLLDEPAAGLSELESAELGTLIRELARGNGMAVGLVEHDMALVMSVCDRVVVIDAGRVIAIGTPAEVSADQAVRAAYLGGSSEPAEPAEPGVVAP